MLTEQAILQSFRDGLDTKASVRSRRPNRLYQVNLPAFMADGDAAQIYLEVESPSKLVMTDLGATCMRLSYTTKLTKALEAALAEAANAQGFSYADGEFRVEIAPGDMLPAALGLLQIQAQAEQLATRVAKRSQDGIEFRAVVRDFLVEVFGEKVVEAPYVDSKLDEEGDYPLDALVHTKVPIAVATPSSDLSAERSLTSKLKLENSLPGAQWVAIPRDIERLATLTRRRLMRDFTAVCSSFERDRDSIGGKLRGFAA